MPHVINGVGTWYHGKQNLITRRGVCPQCGAIADLKSYDTTLFVVVLFIPIIPISKKHIIDDCGSCRRHRVIKLSEWQTLRTENIAKAVAACRESPANEELAVKALATAAMFESENALDALRDFAERNHGSSARVQAALGDALEHMNRHQPAIDTLLRAHELARDNPSAERLAEVMFKHGEPKDALPLIDHIFAPGAAKKKWLAYLGVEALQSRAQHEEALALLARIRDAFPDAAATKHHKKYVKDSEKRMGSGKRVKSRLAQLDRKEAGPQGKWAGRWPWLIGPSLALLFAAWFLWMAVSRGSAREVWLVNGLAAPYHVQVAGRSLQVRPNSPVKITVPMGEVAWRAEGQDVTVPPGSARVWEGLLARPFSGRVFVINPDRNAVVILETATYSQSGNQSNAGDGLNAFCGQNHYEFTGLDYVFTPMPQRVESGGRSQRSGLWQYYHGPASAAGVVLSSHGQADAVAMLHRMIAQDPRYEEAYHTAYEVLGPVDFDKAVAPVLPLRPLVVDAHRHHMSAVEAKDPTRDLMPEYRALLAEDPNDPIRMYLLARLTHDGAEAARLLDAAIAAPSPPALAFMARARLRHGEGRIAEAMDDAKRSMQLGPDIDGVAENDMGVLIASGDAAAMLQHPALTQAYADMSVRDAVRKVYALCLMGQGGAAGQAIVDIANEWQLPPEDDTRKMLQADRAALLGDWSAYEQSATTPYQRLIIALRAGDWGAASTLANEADSEPSDWRATMTLALGAAGAGKSDIALQAIEHAASAMSKGSWEERTYAAWLSASTPPAFSEVVSLPADPDLKRLTTAALGVKFPAISAECFTLARTLNGDQLPPHQVLQSVVGGE